MSSNVNSAAESTEPVKTHKAPGDRPLYFNNVGLFSDVFLLHHLPEIEKNNSSNAGRFLDQHWNTESLPDFSVAYETMMSLWEQYGEIFPTLSEAQLEERWIRPVLKLLGWEFEVQERLQKRGKTQIPDYSLFSSEAAYIKAKKAKTPEGYFGHVLAVADAKAMEIPLDGTGRSNANPSYQIARYMEDTGKAWGILTNGRYWRLYSLRSNSKHTVFFEINIDSILAKRDDSRFKYFYNFFRKESFVTHEASGQSFLDVVLANGEFYAKQVEKSLKARVFRVVENICRGFAEEAKPSTEEERKQVYDHSLYYLFRLMFVLNCESKGLLNVDRQSDYFEFSLRSICSNLRNQFEEGKEWSNQPRTYNAISDLLSLLKSGDNRIGIHGFGDQLLSAGKPDFFKKHRIADRYLNLALLELACDYDEDGRLKFIDYKRMSADHMGSLFEGLLEYQLCLADKKLCVDGEKIVEWSKISEKKKAKLLHSIINVGDLYLSNTSGERKETGSYYTPEYIVDHVVEHTLSPIIKELSNPEKVFELRVVDPSLGSGHFLLGAIRYLEASYLEALHSAEGAKADTDQEAVRQRVLSECVYGVDINPLAVELARFSLWMYTARKGHRLEPLDKSLQSGNSLGSKSGNSFDWGTRFKIPNIKFDAVVGNPPYVRIQTLESDATDFYGENYKSAVGNYDVYCLFVEKGVSLLKPEGRLGFILPHRFMKTDYGEGLRSFLIEKRNLAKVIDFDGYMVFENASINTCLLFLAGKETPNFFFTQVHNIALSKEEMATLLKRLPHKEHRERDFTTGEIEVDSLSANPWIMIWKHERKMWNKLDQVPTRLSDCTKSIFQGLKTGADPVFIGDVVDKRGGTHTLKMGSSDDPVQIESNLLRPLIKGGQMRRWAVEDTNKLIIFPYLEGKLIPEEDMRKKFPLAWKHLSKNRSTLEARDGGDMKHAGWYGYSRNQALTSMDNQKIVTPDYYSEASYSFDSTGKSFFCGGGAGGYGILLNQAKDTKFVLALLNSSIVDWYLRKITVRAYQTAYMYVKKYITDLPIAGLDDPSPEHKKFRSEIEGLADKIMKLRAKEMAASAPGDKSELRVQICALERECDVLVGKLYGVDVEDVLNSRPENRAEDAPKTKKVVAVA